MAGRTFPATRRGPKARGASGVRLGVAVLGLAALTACTAQYRDHGYIPREEELSQIAVGSDTKDSVTEKVGAPSTAGLLSDSGFYYVGSRVRTYGMFRPQVVEREVVAISFSSQGVVTNVERFGLEKGRVVPLARRVTSSSTANKNFIRQLLGNLGRFSASDFID